MKVEKPPFGAIYFDSNILLANHWPDPLPELANVLDLARWWGIAPCIPVPVLEEVKCHWLRELRESIRAFRGARGKVAKAAHPIKVDLRDEDLDVSGLQAKYDEMNNHAIQRFGIHTVDYTHRSTAEMFGHATHYRRPFAAGGQGRGFQDAVILLSIVDNLNDSNELKGILITSDTDFNDAEYSSFASGFHIERLRVLKLEAVWEELFQPYFDETRTKPYRKLAAEADQLAKAKAEELRQFASRMITPDMLRPLLGDRVLQTGSLERFDVRSVDVPFPATDEVMSKVAIAIKVMGTFDARVVTGLALLRNLFGGISLSTDPPTREQNKKLHWLGVIEASGFLVDGTLREITPESLSIQDV